ncbi:MAG: hypothetical protein VR64_02075 [Desulfatitalea sp. BRH_c12]|nr:MAG: hypothetical protein VR64_02075 [Desulfatitalea sp. BRH_c12]
MNKNESALVDHLRTKLQEAEDLLDAIRGGRIDALVVSGPEKDKIYTLKGADHTYRILIETMDEGAVIVSREGTVLYCNRRFAEMLQQTIHHVMGNAIAKFLAPPDLERFASLQSRAFAEEGMKAELHLKAVGGSTVPALVSLRTLAMDDMDVLCMVVTDLTEQKATEQTLKSYSQRLYRQNAELKRRAEQLARLSSELTMAESRERKRMSKILHDGLQQLLASAKLQAGSLVEDLVNGDHKESAGDIENILAEAIKVSRSLSMDLSPPILHEGGLATGLEWLKRSMDEKYNFQVALHLGDNPELPDDINIMVFEAVRELLFNAFKHAGVQKAELHLEHAGDNLLRIDVFDEGAGFDMAHLDGLDAGGGFGLFSIRERMGLIGGSLQVESTLGQGSHFTLMVPMVKQPQIAPPARENRSIAGVEDIFVQGTRTRVLLADDHTLFRDGLSRILERETDIEVIGHATSGREAIELARKLKPNVILMDVSMPDINGIEATAVIRNEIPEIRIIGLSMYEDQERARVMFQAGADDYKNKGCAASELISAVRHLSENRHPCEVNKCGSDDVRPCRA